MKQSIGIFTAAEGEPMPFFGCDDQALVAALYKHASEIIGMDMCQVEPISGLPVKRVGEVVVQQVEDPTLYKIAADDVGKPETGRKPTGEAGSWTIQSLIFSKDAFTMDEAKQWIADHSENFGNYGVDETDTSYRFRQYDPQWFDQYRTITLEDGLAAAYGRIASERVEEDAAKAEQERSETVYKAVRKINKSMLEQGVRILCKSADVDVVKEGDEEHEERFVLSMVLEPNDGEDGAPLKPDTQDDVYSKADVRAACHVWMEYYGAIDLMHSWRALGKEHVRVLECYIAPIDFQSGDDLVIKGSWMLAVRIVDDELWAAVKRGELGAYSIGGQANRVPLQAA